MGPARNRPRGVGVLRHNPTAALYEVGRCAARISGAGVDVTRTGERRSERDGDREREIVSGSTRRYAAAVDRALAVLDGGVGPYGHVRPVRCIVTGQPERPAGRVVINPAAVCCALG